MAVVVTPDSDALAFSLFFCLVTWLSVHFWGFVNFGLAETMNTNIAKVMLQNHVQVIFHVP